MSSHPLGKMVLTDPKSRHKAKGQIHADVHTASLESPANDTDDGSRQD